MHTPTYGTVETLLHLIKAWRLGTGNQSRGACGPSLPVAVCQLPYFAYLLSRALNLIK